MGSGLCVASLGSFGEEGFEVLRGAAAEWVGAGHGGDAEVSGDLFHDVGDGAGGEVVFQGLQEFGRVQALAELGLEGGIVWGAGAVDGVFHVADDLCMGVGLGASVGVRGLEAHGFGDVLGHEDAAADGARDAVEGDRRVGARGVRVAGAGRGVVFGLGCDVAGEAGAEFDEFMQGCPVELGVLVVRAWVLLAEGGLGLHPYIGS